MYICTYFHFFFFFSSTKEYSQFRRLWDDSGSLTRLNNARVTSLCCAGKRGGVGSGVGSGVGGGSGAAVAGPPLLGTEEGTLELQGGEAGARRASGPVAASTSATTTCWAQALRSEWASPSETIIDAVAASPTLAGAATLATVVAAAPAAGKGGGKKGEEELAESAAVLLEGAARARRRAGAEIEGEEGGGAASPPSRRGVTFSLQHGRDDDDPKRFSQAAAAAAAVEDAVGRAAEVSRGRGEAEKQEGGCTAVGSTRQAEADAVAGGGGGGGCGPATETEVVRWGRMDLLSVLYPPQPAAAAGEGRQID